MNINEFAELVYRDRLVAFAKKGFVNLDPEFECAVNIVRGIKYTKIDVGPRNNWSGKFMIDDAGNIYGIKAYGVPNKRKHYGTLETAENWFWGEYYPIQKEAQP